MDIGCCACVCKGNYYQQKHLFRLVIGLRATVACTCVSSFLVLLIDFRDFSLHVIVRICLFLSWNLCIAPSSNGAIHDWMKWWISRIIEKTLTISHLFCIAAKILLFYVIFYAVLAGFFGAMLTVFYQTLDPNAPKWQLDNSLIGSNPGLGFRPMPPASNVESTLIWYKASDEGNFLHWTRELDKFLEGNFILSFWR